MTLSREQINELHRRAEQAMREGRPRVAHQHCLSILKADRKHADAWFLCGVIAGQNGQSEKAVEIINNAVHLDPERAEYLAELGKHLLAIGLTRDALAAAQKALTLQPRDVPSLCTLGTLLSHLGEHPDAIACFEQASERLASRSESSASLGKEFVAEFLFNFAVSLQFAGDFERAEQVYENAISQKPAYFKAHSALATLRKYSGEDNHLARLEALRDQASSAIDKLHLGHAIAKELEDTGRYEEALASLDWAKEEQARSLRYHFNDDAALFKGIANLATEHSFTDIEQRGCLNEEPIFIVGMPRTGTTLLEQILGGHSAVYAAGELQNFPLQAALLTGGNARDPLTRSSVESAWTLDMGELGHAYIESTRPRTGHTAHFIDKLPLNFLYLGLIHRALPRAKLVCLRRDPMDTCLSNYRQLFATNFRHYYYNLDLLDCGRYYIEFDRLMAHWHQVIPGVIHEVRYEELVADTERVTKELLAHCGLPWEDACLMFNERNTSVATPSAVQVRQGIYTSSVDRWRRYGDAMLPLYEMLQDAGYYD